MEKPFKLDSIQPRSLRFRSHYKIYFLLLISLSILTCAFWLFRLFDSSIQEIFLDQRYELIITSCYFALFSSYYFFWLRYRLNNSVQVFESHLFIHNGKHVEKVLFEDIESVSTVAWSIFYLKMKNGHKYYFNSSLERVDYVWEGVKRSRPDLVSDQDFESFRINLVQYDHHQKRKEWFFKHKLVDVFNWVILPCIFLLMAYSIQSREVNIHQASLYFFRLGMYSVLILLVSTFIFSMLLKRFIFDKKFKVNIGTEQEKIRDLEFEGIVLHRSKLFQMVLTSFFLGLVIRTDINLYSLTKAKNEMSNFDIKKGNSLVIDNRYNCIDCKYRLKDGDLVFFGRGMIGQVLAKEGEMVGQVSQDSVGRSIASENIHEVPVGHVAVRTANGQDIVFVKLKDLIGKIQK